jgi:uncharacterized protein
VSCVVVLAGGSPHAHDYGSIGAALVDVITSAGHDVELTDHPDRAIALLTDADALVMNGLWWQMEGDAYEPWRGEFAYSPTPETRSGLSSFVHEGGGFVAMHTTPICFDDWPEWGDVVGGAWHWGRSSHPPAARVSASVIAHHPVVSQLPAAIELFDEVYGDLDVRADVEVLAVARRHPGDENQPVVWTHRHGTGRVVFDAFGHDATSIRDDRHARLVQQSVAWVTETA